MNWKCLPGKCRAYLLIIYVGSIPFAFLSFHEDGSYTPMWFLFTSAAFFIATISLNLPQLPVITISMGDVFTILALTRFGLGPALVTYWANVIATAVAGHVRRYGLYRLRTLSIHRLFFNLSCCALSVYGMGQAYKAVTYLVASPASVIIGLASIAGVWFLINTITLSLAVSLSTGRPFLRIWKEGVGLYLLNFFGSAAAAGLISLFYEKAGFVIFLLSLPIAVVLYQLHRFYIERYQQAQTHIAELNDLYLQTVEAMANALDAKDRYTHGHIRRVQAYAVELAKLMGNTSDLEVMAIRAGALLHDIGKIAIPEYILNKPAVLTETEFEKMKIHPVVGANILADIKFPYPVVPTVKFHHERWDGNGYPDRLRGEEIPITARILSLADCYDALTTDRPYRSPMSRNQIVDFFRREAGGAYDPAIVEKFVENLDQIEAAAKDVKVAQTDVWGIREIPASPAVPGRQLQRVHPTVTYGKALTVDSDLQRELYSVFEFAHASLQCLGPDEIFSFIGAKLLRLVEFDAAVFFRADLTQGILIAEHTVGKSSGNLQGLTLSLEQKLTGWVAANNQSLCNLPPFPDFLKCAEPRPDFQTSAIAPLNRHGEVLGAISLYRNEAARFTEDEFRRLEIVASQVAILLERSAKQSDETAAALFDPLTALPNGFQLYLTFDQVAADASRYEYPLALLSISLDEIRGIRRKWGQMIVDEAVRTTARYLQEQLRETDFLVRYGTDEFMALNPKMTNDGAEALKSRLQDELDHFQLTVRPGTSIPLQVSIGLATYPDDGADLEKLLAVAEWRMREDRELRNAVKRRISRRTPH